MKIKDALTVLENRANQLLFRRVETLVKKIDEDVAAAVSSPAELRPGNYKSHLVDETQKVLEAYEVYKNEQGYRWAGTHSKAWVKKDGTWIKKDGTWTYKK